MAEGTRKAGRKRLVPISEDSREIVDLPRDQIDPEDGIGAEALPPAEGEASPPDPDNQDALHPNMLKVRGEYYPLPRMGPAIAVIVPKRQREMQVAWDKRETLLKQGYTETAAFEQSGVTEASMRMLEMVCAIASDSIPEEVLVTLSWEEIYGLAGQFRPFGGSDQSSESQTGPKSTPETEKTKTA